MLYKQNARVGKTYPKTEVSRMSTKFVQLRSNCVKLVTDKERQLQLLRLVK